MPTTSATLPPMPASISSKTKVLSSLPPVIFLMASMILESSPPEATLRSGLKGSPGVRRKKELHLVPAVLADQALVRDLDLEPHTLHGKEGKLLHDEPLDLFRPLLSCDADSSPAIASTRAVERRPLRLQVRRIRLQVDKLIEPRFAPGPRTPLCRPYVLPYFSLSLRIAARRSSRASSSPGS